MWTTTASIRSASSSTLVPPPVAAAAAAMRPPLPPASRPPLPAGPRSPLPAGPRSPISLRRRKNSLLPPRFKRNILRFATTSAAEAGVAAEAASPTKPLTFTCRILGFKTSLTFNRTITIRYPSVSIPFLPPTPAPQRVLLRARRRGRLFIRRCNIQRII